MKIFRIVSGAYQTNCYILRNNEYAKDCLIIDAGLEADGLISFLQKNELNPLAVVLTHGHADHIVGVTALRQNYPKIKVYIHKLDASMLIDAERNLSALTGELFSTAAADFLVEDDSIIGQAGMKLEVLHTPGHTPGGICLYIRNDGVVFTNDTLFADSVGRTDFPGGSMIQLVENIRKRLFILPGKTVVYPGHGPRTTIEQEKTHNQYVQEK